jgi:23S rRNA (cytosine1962-C5)-methyltransferase
VILDPPAFAKKRADVVMAAKGYREINRLAIQKMPPSSLLLTCSCSSYIDPTLFQQLIFQASFDAQRTVRILGRHIQAPDHPISVYHPEGVYLKSFLLYIS